MRSSNEKRTIFIMGDVHGRITRLQEHLQSAGLVDASFNWNGESAVLWFVGDYVDRGPAGAGVIKAIMRLQNQARESGGQVGALIGNHDILLLSAVRYRDTVSATTQQTYYADWIDEGGNLQDLERLGAAEIDWLMALPAAALVADTLLLHADSLLYRSYGTSLEALNQAFHRLLADGSAQAYNQLLDEFGQHRAFLGADGAAHLAEMLLRYGGSRLVHGHTPIMKITGAEPAAITAPYVYQDGKCINVDGGMYLGGPGFIYQLNQ
ncbi:MAG: metallophosphoesterase [Anaerolineales bacterium]|jgi:hypothetical protein